MQTKAVIKNADMSEDMQQDAVDCASQALTKYNIEKVSTLVLVRFVVCERENTSPKKKTCPTHQTYPAVKLPRRRSRGQIAVPLGVAPAVPGFQTLNPDL